MINKVNENSWLDLHLIFNIISTVVLAYMFSSIKDKNSMDIINKHTKVDSTCSPI